MANQSKLYLSLLALGQDNLLLIATAYKFIQLNKLNKQRKHSWWVHDINRNWFQQRAYHNLVKELQFDGEKFQQYSRLTRESKIPLNCSGNTCSWHRNDDPPVIWIISLYLWYQVYFVIIIVEFLVTVLSVTNFLRVDCPFKC